MAKIEITIDEQGNASVGVKEFAGPGCVKFTKEIEEALGAQTQDTKTREFTQRAMVGATQTVKAGG